MGTIQKRDDNAGRTTYQARIRKAGHPALSKNFDSKADAQRWITEREAEMSRGQFLDTRAAENTTLADLIPKYVANVSVLKKGGDIEAIRLGAMLRDRITEYALSGLSTAIVADYRDRRLQKVSGSTVGRDMALLHHVIEKARKEWGVGLQSNPFAGVEKPKAAPSRVRRLAPHEEKAILIECGRSRGGYLRPVVMLAVETAMRQSEIVDLDWGRIDLKKRVARLWTTKNGETRGVPLSWNAVDILEQLPAERNVRDERAGRVFPDLTTEALKRAFIRACERAKVKDFHFHDLRHEATSRLFETQKFNVMEVASITGHKTLAMLKRYTHLAAEDLAKRM